MNDGENQLHIPLGFSFSAGTAGLKASGKPDLALALAREGTSAAAVFTTNRVVAAPIEVGREHLALSRGRIRAVLVNSGNANCATGQAGYTTCKQTCAVTAKRVGIAARQVFPSSTGVIGVPLSGEKITAQLPQLVAQAESSETGV